MKLKKISKWFEKNLYHVKIPFTSLGYILLIVIVFIISGGVYDILERPIALLPSPSSPVPLFFYPGISAQTLNESIQAFFLFTIGIIGGFLVLRSTRYTYKPRESGILLIIGLVMIIVGYLGCLSVLTSKAPGIWR